MSTATASVSEGKSSVVGHAALPVAATEDRPKRLIWTRGRIECHEANTARRLRESAFPLVIIDGDHSR